MANWRWLKPGMHVKRWVFLITIGLFAFFIGAMFLTLGMFFPDSMPFGMESYGTGGLLVGVGMIAVFVGIYRLVRRIEKMLRRSDETRNLGEIAYQYHRLEQGPRLVCFGGGHGLSTLLSGLRDYSRRITAVVSVADDGGSSGRLRSDFDTLPPGDIRNCLVALADTTPAFTQLLQFRFDDGELAGHSFGNLFILALSFILGDFGSAIREMNHILSVRGQVVPATLDKVSLVANHPDGSKTTGQKWIAKCNKPIDSMELRPHPGEIPAEVRTALHEADLITLGPGSLFTSILPNLIDTKIVEAINASPAKVLLIVNTAGQEGETKGFAVSDYLAAVARLAPGLRIDLVLVNDREPGPEKAAELDARGVALTVYDPEKTEGYGARVLLRDVINMDKPWRHDPRKTAQAVMSICSQELGLAQL